MKLLVKASFISFLFCTNALAGEPIPRKSNADRLMLLFGVRAGINFTSVNVLNSYAIFASTSVDNNPNFKTYSNWLKNIGSQYGLIGMIKFDELSSLVVQPSFIFHNFNYTNRFIWTDNANPGDNITLVYEISRV
jgi:hypothetical protein